MAERYLMVPVRDLRYLELSCHKCGTGIVIDLADPSKAFPEKCPVCPAILRGTSKPMAEVLQSYRDFHAQLADSPTEPHFRLLGETAKAD